MTYSSWLASLDTSDASIWDAMLNSSDCPVAVMADWVEEHGGQRWYADLASHVTLDVRATEYKRWEEMGLESLQMWHEPTYVNEEPDGFEQSNGEWYIADDSHQAIIWGTYGNYNSPGSSHHTYATIFRDASEYQAALAEWESKPEWLESEDNDYLDEFDDDGSADGEEEQDDASIPF